MEKSWNFYGEETVNKASAFTIRTILNTLNDNLNKDEHRTAIPLAHGDPSGFPTFRTSNVAEDALIDAIKSGKYNSYGPSVGFIEARRSIAEYISGDQPFEISADDVYITVGARHAIDVILTVLARPGGNILFPKPGYPFYEARATFSHLEFRHFNLLPKQGWEVDLNHIETLADDKTVAIVITNPGNPCGNVYSREHLQKIAETAKRLGFLVIADEAYAHLAFGKNPFVPMQVFGSIAPVITVGSLSKRWMVPGWRFGWLVTCDPNGILKKLGVVDSIKSCLDITCDAPTFIQGAVPKILKEIPDDFYSKTVNLLKEAADVCFERLTEIPCITCPYKPEGSMFTMVKLNPSLLEGIDDDLHFCLKLAREESVIVLPGVTMGLKNWLRVTFAVKLATLEDGLARIQSFCSRHAKS
ncbi:hypothetical protein M9H77_11726 [Catharanthus roseus]|uniref:Uncharacterized protein n=1 Tax=Catharanthus roseus TaxID=4058 RepID=A0ACC0BFD9_CATRO|nr:hypothetical protein M9H77_11726 [Catharanthus roseus]